MLNALIGFSGFVGSTLLKQTSFEALYRSININEIRGKEFDTIVCAGAPAQKWIANREPLKDKEQIDGLIENLQSAKCKKFVLISTVDVFKNPVRIDESSEVDEEGLHAYGLNRRYLEKFVANHFSNHLIVRLPGLVGPGLRKNIIFDLLNDNNLQAIESRNRFQFYPMVNLWYDIQTALQASVKLVHLTAAPISVADVAYEGFGKNFKQEFSSPLVSYDFQTKHAQIFGVNGRYQYSGRETLQAIRAYAQSEPLKTKNQAGSIL